MKLAKEKVDLSWLHQPEYEVLMPIWEKERDNFEGPSETNSYGFRRVCKKEKGRGTTIQHIDLIVDQKEKRLEVDISNPNTLKQAMALLTFNEIPPSPRQFQKLVFLLAKGDSDTLSAAKTNLRDTWRAFLAAVEKMPVVEHAELHIDNTDEGWLE